MIVLEEEVSDTLIVHVSGEALDAGTSKDFRKQIKDKLEGRKRVVLDLSTVGFVDSSGLGVLIACLRQVTAAGGDLKLFGLSAQVRALFELVRMHRLFSIYNTRDEAVRAFQ
jgi:anti-sigma B factor antagonist